MHVHMYVCVHASGMLATAAFVVAIENALYTKCSCWQFGIPVWPITDAVSERERESKREQQESESEASRRVGCYLSMLRQLIIRFTPNMHTQTNSHTYACLENYMYICQARPVFIV